MFSGDIKSILNVERSPTVSTKPKSEWGRTKQMGKLAEVLGPDAMQTIATTHLGVSHEQYQHTKKCAGKDSWWLNLCILAVYLKQPNNSFKVCQIFNKKSKQLK